MIQRELKQKRREKKNKIETKIRYMKDENNLK